MLRKTIAGVCYFVALAALARAVWTGRYGGDMWGVLGHYYGYTAYFESAAPFAAPLFWPLAVYPLLLSTNRCGWVGVLAGWAYLGGWRRRTFAAALIVLAVVGGRALKPMPYNDVLRRQIWSQALAHPGAGGQAFSQVHIWGMPVAKAHSELLQVYVDFGRGAFVAAIALFLGALCWLEFGGPKGLGAAAATCLTVQLLFDNRLHYPPCAALFAATWAWAWMERWPPAPPGR